MSFFITCINMDQSNDHFIDWPILTAPAVHWHLPISTATIKEHAKQQPQNMLSIIKPTTQGKSMQIRTNPNGNKQTRSRPSSVEQPLWILWKKQSTLIWVEDSHITLVKGIKTYLHMISSLMQSLFNHCQREMHFYCQHLSIHLQHSSNEAPKTTIFCIGQWDINNHQRFPYPSSSTTNSFHQKT